MYFLRQRSKQLTYNEVQEICKTLFHKHLLPLISLAILLSSLSSSSALAALTRQPYLQSVSDTRVVLRWRTASSANSRVSYGTTQGSLNNKVDDSNTTNEHEVVVTGLTPNTKYFYSVGSTNTTEAGNDTDHYFITAPATGSNRKLRIWAIGDPGTGDNNQADVRNAYYNLDSVATDVVLTLGDNAYNDGTDSEYTNNFFNVYQDLFRHSPVWATRGNHERSLSAHETAFTHPINAESGGVASGSELYYSFDYGNIHFVCLDSFTSANLNGTAMYNWLENDLASTTQKWIIAFWHHPPYSRSSAHDSNSESGQRITREKANPILEKYGVDLQLGGHNHFYSRTYLINKHYDTSSTYSAATHAIDTGDGRKDGDGSYNKGSSPDGAVYVLAGSSGKLGYTPITHPANYVEVKVLGSMVIDVDDDRMDVRLLRENNTIEDYFTITKTANINLAPVVNSGTDQTVDSDEVVNLNGTVTDDSLPVGAALIPNWSKISGPGTVSFGNANAVDTTATFSTSGSYILQLETSDTALSSSDTVAITVTAPIINIAPSFTNALINTSNATTGQAYSDRLSGDASDPDNNELIFSKVSGPAWLIVAGNGDLNGIPGNSDTGNNNFQIQVSDGNLSDTATLSIIVQSTTASDTGQGGLSVIALMLNSLLLIILRLLDKTGAFRIATHVEKNPV